LKAAKKQKLGKAIVTLDLKTFRKIPKGSCLILPSAEKKKEKFMVCKLGANKFSIRPARILYEKSQKRS